MMRRILRGLAPLVLASGASAQLLINVEVDYMVASGHSHQPPQQAIDALVQMFACHGHTLNIWVSDAIPEVSSIQTQFPGISSFFTGGGTNSFNTFKSTYSQTAGFGGWHYCIIGHDYNNGNGTGSSGLGETGGDDFVVTLGSWPTMTGTPYEIAATFAHELGHNLGLRHYSPDSLAVSGEFAPNYASVMSYQYQLNGIKTQMACLGLIAGDHLLKDLDYSNGRMPTLSEPALVEKVGVGIHNVDWNCSGTIAASTVNHDLDTDADFCTLGNGSSVLQDYNDWANIVDSTDEPEVYNDLVELEVVECITFEEHDAQRGDGVRNPAGCGTAPTLAVEPCITQGLMTWVTAGGAGPQLGTGDDPFQSLGAAVFVSPLKSVLYLQPGTFTNGNNPMVLDRTMVLAGPGGAVIDP